MGGDTIYKVTNYGNCYTNTAATTAAATWNGCTDTVAPYAWPRYFDWQNIRICHETVELNSTLKLPDGAKLIVDNDGNYRIEDKDAKVTYQANRLREFSPYLNASDLLAKFVEYVGTLGVRRGEAVMLPLNLFVAWLVIEAAGRDGDPIPQDIAPIENTLAKVVRPKCLMCGKFVRRVSRFPFCSPAHGAIYLEKHQSIIAR